MNEKPIHPKKDIYSYLALLLCFALFVAGVCGIVSSRTASQDYEPIAIKDSDGNTTDWKYEAKLSFDVEGKTYTGKDTFYRDISSGEKVTVEVYRTGKGEYKLTPEGNPADFLLYCMAVVVGGFLTVVMTHSVVAPNKKEEAGEKSGNNKNKR